MSYHDLPRDWPTRSIGDPAIFVDLVDLVVSVADREAGAVYVLICGPRGRLAQPCAVTDFGWGPVLDKRAVIEPFAQAAHHGPKGSGLGLVVARPGVLRTTDEDRDWHEATAAVCRDHQLKLVAVGVATPRAIWRLDAFTDLTWLSA